MAVILKLSDYRSTDIADDEIDLLTAVDAAIRDLREVLLGLRRGAATRARVRTDVGSRLLQNCHLQVCDLNYATTLSRKDWHSSVNRAVV